MRGGGGSAHGGLPACPALRDIHLSPERFRAATARAPREGGGGGEGADWSPVGKASKGLGVCGRGVSVGSTCRGAVVGVGGWGTAGVGEVELKGNGYAVAGAEILQALVGRFCFLQTDFNDATGR